MKVDMNLSSDELDIDLLSDEATQNPYPLFEKLRLEDPVHYSKRYRSWILTRHDDVQFAFKDSRFLSDRLTGYRQAKLSGPDADPDQIFTFEVLAGWLVFMDGPDHLRLRRLVRQAFTPKVIAALQGSIEDQAATLVASFSDRGRIDVLNDYAFELTAGVICDMLGAPRADRGLIKQWSEQITDLLAGTESNAERNATAANGIRKLVNYLTDLVRQYTHNPSENLLSQLITARDEGNALSQQELVSTAILLLFAGHETTTKLITTFVLTLLQNPDQGNDLLSGQIPIARAVEEVLRFNGPAQGDLRVLGADIELRGKALKKGQRVLLMINSANRDAEVFENPDVVNLRRERNLHIGFGFGAHACLGAPLARLEASIAVPVLFRGLKNLRMDAGFALHWNPGLLNRGLDSLWVEWDADNL